MENPAFSNVKFVLRILLAYLALSVGCFLMLRTIIGYLSFRDDVQFLLLKQDYIHIPVWKAAFYVHVFSAIVALCAGFTQFSPEILKDYRWLHRLAGRIYVWDILVVNFPAGLIMGIYANGGMAGKSAFILLDVLWFAFTWKAFVCVLKKDFAGHKDYMIRSYALTFSAITLRTWKIVFSHLFVIDLQQLYIIDAWMGFLPNLMIAEWLIRSKKNCVLPALTAKTDTKKKYQVDDYDNGRKSEGKSSNVSECFGSRALRPDKPAHDCDRDEVSSSEANRKNRE